MVAAMAVVGTTTLTSCRAFHLFEKRADTIVYEIKRTTAVVV